MSRLIALFLLLAVILPMGAEAHAVLLQAEPADGAVLAHPPAEIVLRFNEPVRPIKLELLDDSGKVLSGEERVSARDLEIRLAVPPGLREGSYFVSYRVTSLDSHAVGGSTVFSIGHASAPGLAWRQQGSARPWAIFALADRLAFYIGLIGATGGVLFHGLVARDLGCLDRASRRALVGFGLLAIGSGFAGIGIEGASLEDAAGYELLDLDLWTLGESTSLGLSLTIAILCLLLALFAVVEGKRLRPLAPPAAVAALVSLAMTGHALTAGPFWLTAPPLALHVLAAGFWLGALWPLWRSLQSLAPPAAAMLLRRFSGIAVFAVAILIAAGTALAVLQLGRVAALLDTAYGLRLLSKLAFVTVLLSLAAANRLWLTPALTAGRADAANRLRASIGLEIGLGLAILAITSSLGETPPPRSFMAREQALAFVPKAGFSVVTFAGANSALIEVTPARAGRNEIAIRLFDAQGAPLRALDVELEISNPAAGIEPIRRKPARTAPGLYRYEATQVSPAGRWKLKLEVLISEFAEARFETDIPIPP
jgi:copper transport protein